MALHSELLELIRCPKCHGKLVLRSAGDAETLECAPCRLAYAVIGDIPQLLVDEAKPLGA